MPPTLAASMLPFPPKGRDLMKHIVDLIRRDARHALASAIGIVVLVGIMVVPSFYAWFNIAGSWDPYGNTDALNIAVANEDAGYSSELVPVALNLGDRVVANLMRSDSIGYVAASREEALEGVRAGTYYAAVIIPENFSSCLLSTLSDTPQQAQVAFYQNQKENAIAQIVTNKAASAVERDIDRSFSEAVTDVGAGALAELASFMDDDQLAQAAAKLDDALAGSSQTLTDASGAARSFSGIIDTSQALLGTGTGALEGGLTANSTVTSDLRDSAESLADLDSTIDNALAGVDAALQTGSDDLDEVREAIDGAIDTISTQSSDLSDALSEAKSDIDQYITTLEEVSTALEDKAAALEQREQTLPADSPAYAAVHAERTALENVNTRIEAILTELTDLSTGLETTIGDLAQAATDAEDARSQLASMVDTAATSLEDARSTYDTSLKGTLTNLANDIDSAAENIDALLDDADSAMSAANQAITGARTQLSDAASTLAATADDLEGGAMRLTDLQTQLDEALASSNMDEVRAILAATPNALGAFVSQPVEMDRHAVFPVENNGSAMTPFYTVLSIWIGGVVLAALVKTTPSTRALAETGCSERQAYLGRLVFFCVLGIAQALIICAGDLWYLGVQCVHPALFLLAGCVASIIFVNIIFSLAATFGDVGKAVAVILMVMQVAGAGGTFPPQMLPAPFQAIYPWLPFVHAEGAMRAAMFGLYGNDFWIELALLVSYLVPTLVLGLALRKRAARLNERMEHALESTHIM